MTFTVRTDTAPDYTLCEDDTTKSILQNISLILGTRKGTVPMYREFGLSMEFVDKPMDVAQTMMYAEIEEAFEEFEPRATLTDISFEANYKGELVAVLEVEI